MDYLWNALGYKTNGVTAKYPEAVELIDDFLKKHNPNARIHPGCGGVHRMSDKRVKRIVNKARATSAVRTAVEANGFTCDIERVLLEECRYYEGASTCVSVSNGGAKVSVNIL
jgi:hypothetical protein